MKVAVVLAVVIGLFGLWVWAEAYQETKCNEVCAPNVVLKCDIEHRIAVCVIDSKVVYFNH